MNPSQALLLNLKDHGAFPGPPPTHGERAIGSASKEKSRISHDVRRKPVSNPHKLQAQTSNITEQERDREPWQVQKAALLEKFGGSSWSPRKRLSPDSLEGIRALHAQYPDKFTTPVLADQFKVSPDAIRRILRSKWRPSEEEEEKRRERWNRRGINIWSQMNELGIKPPRKWRDQGVGKSGDHVVVRSQRQRPEKAASKSTSTGEIHSERPPASTIATNPNKTDATTLADRII
ncbi:Required for respiratory growth protein 9 mitochondrial [Lecanora helva]